MLLLASSVCFAIAYFGLVRNIQLIGSTPAAMIMNLELVFTTAFALVLLGEPTSVRQLVGGGIVLAAVLVSQGALNFSGRGGGARRLTRGATAVGRTSAGLRGLARRLAAGGDRGQRPSASPVC